jgi:hypothetical protein
MSAWTKPDLLGIRWPRGLGSAAVVLVLALSLAGCMTATDVDLPPPRTDAAEGAVAPAGLTEIRKGMTQREVLRILRPFHQVMHAADASPEMPIMDVFVYVEDGQTKYGEILYDGDRVVDVRYGYTERFVLIS